VILIVTPLEYEARNLKPVLEIAPGLAKLAVLGAMGRRAGTVAAALLATEKPEAIVSLGFGGALKPYLHEGDIVLAASVTHSDEMNKVSQPVQGGRDLIDRARIALRKADIAYHVGRIITTQAVLSSPSAKAALGAGNDSLAVDMESVWIAEAAHHAGLPFMSVRAILDPISLTVPRMLIHAAEKPIWFQWLLGGVTAVATPWNVSTLMRLKRCSGIADKSLTKFLSAFLSVSQNDALKEPAARWKM
jgi:hypothetical protein